MKTLTLYVVSVALLGFATLGLAELVTWDKCSGADNSATSCTVHEVNVQPCREAATLRPCHIKKRRTLNISFDFTPNFSGDTLETGVYWATGLVYYPFRGMPTHACDSTPCPATAGTRQTFNYTLSLDDMYMTGIYNIKWKLWNTQEKKCCFSFPITIVN